MKNKRMILPLLVAIVVIGLGVVAGLLLAQRQTTPAQQSSDHSNQNSEALEPDDGSDLDSTIQVNGQTYQYRDGLKTILFLGIDQSAEASVGDVIGSGGRSDTILLYLLDENTQTTQTLEISRDTMMDVDVYNSNGDYAFTGEMQLNMQYAFGKTPRISCRLTREKVSELLYGVKIDACLSLTMDGIAEIVDSIGGVNITFDQDYTYVDPAFTQGTTLKLDGEQAFNFVHYRDIEQQGSNEGRMARQRLFQRALYEQIHNSQDPASTAMTLWNAAEPYLQSDLSASEIQALAEYEMEDTSYQVPGESVAGELHDEFYVDEQALQELIIQLFYEAAQ